MQSLGVGYYLIRDMFETIKDNFQHFKAGESGSRFRDFYDYRQQRRPPGWSPARVLTIFFGVFLAFVGAAIGWLPGPGGFIAIIGLALLAQEFRPMAVVLDWIEPKLRKAMDGLVSIWRRMSVVSQVVIATTFVLTSVSAGYAAYTLLH
jgi:hypothetical protein